MKALIAAFLLICSTQAWGLAWPARPVRFIVGFAPGGGNDFIARFLAQRLSGTLGQQVIVENKPGAGGSIGAEAAIRSAPDGYTLGIISNSYTVNPSLYPMRFDPGEVSFANSGQGSIGHLATVLFASIAGITLNHIPYKGTGPALTDTIAGQTDAVFGSSASTIPHVRAGKLRALAVTTPARLAAEPELPTVAQAGVPGYQVTLWHGLIGPRGLPAPVVERLNAEVSKVLKLKEAADQLQNDGVSPAGGTPEQFRAAIASEIETWARVVKEAGVKAQ